MVRLYGNAPFKAVVIHGGPGAVGSMKGVAQELSMRTGLGVIEPLQNGNSISALVEQLCQQLHENYSGKIVLMGHSWGAWLTALFAAAHPEMTKHVILVGCPPLEDKFVPEIGRFRRENLNADDAEIFRRVVENRAADGDLAHMPQILDHADNFCIIGREKHAADYVDSEMYNSIWPEAAAMRTSGELKNVFRKIQCGITLIQGANDPHPHNGVTQPLSEMGVPCESHILDKCGHSPFMEKYAMEEFYRIAGDIIR